MGPNALKNHQNGTWHQNFSTRPKITENCGRNFHSLSHQQNFFGESRSISMKRARRWPLFFEIIGALQICMEPIAVDDSGWKTAEMSALMKILPLSAMHSARWIDSHVLRSGDSTAKLSRHLWRLFCVWPDHDWHLALLTFRSPTFMTPPLEHRVTFLALRTGD